MKLNPDSFRSRLKQLEEKWSLSNIRQIPEMYYNFVCFADSQQFGKVAVKIFSKGSEFNYELQALEEFSKVYSVKVYDSDTSVCALLLERITPGNSLLTVNDKTAKDNIAAYLIKDLPVLINKEKVFPDYFDWFTIASSKQKTGKTPDRILSYISSAENIFKKIQSCDKTKKLLHGDLHSLNILQTNTGKWKAIDPHGVTGIHAQESSRYIINELYITPENNKLNRLNELVKHFAEKLNEPEDLIARCAFVDQVLSLCWSLEDGDDESDIQNEISNMEILNKFLL
jgi:streptomycin 6-kinase